MIHKEMHFAQLGTHQLVDLSSQTEVRPSRGKCIFEMQPSLTQTKETDQQAGNNFANDFLTILNNKILCIIKVSFSLQVSATRPILLYNFEAGFSLQVSATRPISLNYNFEAGFSL